MNLTIIVAFDNQQAIGLNNNLLWHLPNDLKHFKNITSGHPIVMGRKTFESIGKALPNRDNIVITRSDNFNAENVSVFHSKEEILNYLKDKNYSQAFIIGGAEIYNLFLEDVQTLEITHVDTTISEADTFFPKINWSKWKLIEEKNFLKDENHSFCYKFATYIRQQ